MTNTFTKHDLPFLSAAMDKRSTHRNLMQKVALGDSPSTDKVDGDMSIPKPVVVDANGTMTVEDYKKCSMIMAVCQNMVQKSLTDAAKAAGIPADQALKSLSAWTQAYVDFPLPIFNFKDTQSNEYHEKAFSITANPDVVEKVVNIKGVPDLKDAVIGALKASGGKLISYKNEKRKFNYFGIITGYHETEISIRLVKFQMDLTETNVESLCVKTVSTQLDSFYDTYQFVGDKEMMIKLQAKMQDRLVDSFAEKLFQFINDFYDDQLKNYQKNLENLLKKK